MGDILSDNVFCSTNEYILNGSFENSQSLENDINLDNLFGFSQDDDVFEKENSKNMSSSINNQVSNYSNVVLEKMICDEEKEGPALKKQKKCGIQMKSSRKDLFDVCFEDMNLIMHKKFKFGELYDEATGYLRGTADFLVIFTICFLISRYGGSRQGNAQIKKEKITKKIFDHFRIRDNEEEGREMLGKTCHEVVCMYNLNWPTQVVYQKEEDPATGLPYFPKSMIYNFKEKKIRTKENEEGNDLVKIEIMTKYITSLDYDSINKSFTSGNSTRLFEEEAYVACNLHSKCMAIQLLLKATDMLFKCKGYNTCLNNSSEMHEGKKYADILGQTNLVEHPLLDMLGVVIHEHLELYLCLLVYKNKKSGRGSQTLDSKLIIKKKLDHFFVQPLSMNLHNIRESNMLFKPDRQFLNPCEFMHLNLIQLGFGNAKKKQRIFYFNPVTYFERLDKNPGVRKTEDGLFKKNESIELVIWNCKK